MIIQILDSSLPTYSSTWPDILDAEEHESAEGENGDQVAVLDEGDRVAGQLQGLRVPPQQQRHLVRVKVEPSRRRRPRNIGDVSQSMYTIIN